MIHYYPNLGRNGRLGNQLFQVASVIGIAYDVGEPCLIQPDWRYRRWLSIPETLYGDAGIGIAHVGYLQDLRFFQKIAPTIRQYFSPSEFAREKLADLVAAYGDPTDAVAVHVRCGDYLTMPQLFTQLGHSYYADALDCLRLAGAPAKRIVLFSDDPKLAVERIRPILETTSYCVPQTSSEYEDILMLLYMRMCGSHVIANSTYSWWAAWLAGHPHVRMPDRWGENNFDFQERSLTLRPSHWRVVQVKQ